MAVSDVDRFMPVTPTPSEMIPLGGCGLNVSIGKHVLEWGNSVGNI